MATIYAKVTSSHDGVVLELCHLGYHIMGETVEEVTASAQQFLSNNGEYIETNIPDIEMSAGQQLISFIV